MLDLQAKVVSSLQIEVGDLMASRVSKDLGVVIKILTSVQSSFLIILNLLIDVVLPSVCVFLTPSCFASGWREYVGDMALHRTEIEDCEGGMRLG